MVEPQVLHVPANDGRGVLEFRLVRPYGGGGGVSEVGATEVLDK